MKKLLFPVIGIAICAHFLSACTEGAQGTRPIKVAPAGASKVSTDSSASKKNKIVVADTQGYIKYIEPILDHIKEDEPESFGLVRAIADHTWSINKLSGTRQGDYVISVMRTEDKKPLAWHSRSAIYLDSAATANMDDEEKAKLILTQMVMSVYVKTNQIKSQSDVKADKSNNKWTEDKVYRFFNDEDLEKIQTVTEYLLEKGTDAKIDDIRQKLKENKIIK
ncbi:MAG: hypothetical protein J7501_07645 [Bdellovibrio sp.]|nr:hypothetical protein [Bdellovibrio sp.]